MGSSSRPIIEAAELPVVRGDGVIRALRKVGFDITGRRGTLLSVLGQSGIGRQEFLNLPWAARSWIRKGAGSVGSGVESHLQDSGFLTAQVRPAFFFLKPRSKDPIAT